MLAAAGDTQVNQPSGQDAAVLSQQAVTPIVAANPLSQPPGLKAFSFGNDGASVSSGTFAQLSNEEMQRQFNARYPAPTPNRTLSQNPSNPSTDQTKLYKDSLEAAHMQSAGRDHKSIFRL